MQISWSKAWLLVLGAFVVLVGLGILPQFAAFVLFPTKTLFWLITYAVIGWEVCIASGFLVYIGFSLKIIKESERGVLEVLGKYRKILLPGLCIVLLGLERIRIRQTTREQYVSVDTKNTITLDGVTLSFAAQLYYTLNPDDPDAAYKATYAFEREGGDPEEAIKNLTEAALRSIAGTKDVAYLKDHQDELNDLVLTEIRDTMLSWGFLVRRHVIKELILPKEVGDAIQQALIADAQGKATIATATANKLATIEVAEGDKQKRIKAAEAQEQEQIHDAAGEAARIKALAEVLGGEDQAKTFHLLEKGAESQSVLAPLAAIAAAVMSSMKPPQKP